MVRLACKAHGGKKLVRLHVVYTKIKLFYFYGSTFRRVMSDVGDHDFLRCSNNMRFKKIFIVDVWPAVVVAATSSIKMFWMQFLMKVVNIMKSKYKE